MLMKKSKWLALAGVSLLSVGVLVACSSKSNTSSNTYNYVYTADPETLDYLISNKGSTTDAVTNGVDGLLENDKYGNLVPSIAKDWTVSADGLTYTYKLRKGVKWYTSDGEEYAEVTAKDFVTGLKHAADKKTESIYLAKDSVVGSLFLGIISMVLIKTSLKLALKHLMITLFSTHLNNQNLTGILR